MAHYRIALTITVLAEDEKNAKYSIQEFLEAALVGEPSPIVDYSIEETMEVYD